MFLGKAYYTGRRYLWWMLAHRRFAGEKPDGKLPCLQFAHKTPLLRKLKDVDMYLQYNKIINLRIASGRLNNLVIHPGERFSFWKLIGKPTRSKGYVDGMVLFCGTYHAGTGGGLCQLSNLIYWMTLHTPLTIKERYRHSYDVFPDSGRTQPFGSGATCVYNYRDLIIENNTAQPFQLCLEVTDEYLSGEWRSISEPRYRYHVYEKNHRMNLECWGGYTRHNELRRELYDTDGSLFYDEFITENHAVMMYQPFLEDGNQAAGCKDGNLNSNP
ncbi:MAG: VanW family protein [Clostridia bacterium]|nr:VanW family protein [Clostridia bacterium]